MVKYTPPLRRLQPEMPDFCDSDGQLSANRLQKKFNALKMAGEFLSDFVVKDPSLGCEFLAPTEVPKQRSGSLPPAIIFGQAAGERRGRP